MIKKILVPTDFSDNANIALEYSVEIAKKINSTIILYNVYYVPISSAGTNTLRNYNQIFKGHRKQRLIDEITDLKNEHPDVSFKYEFDEGDPTLSIFNRSIKGDIDLIIMGRTGGSVSVRKLFGSTSSDMINRTKVPLIIVPENLKIKFPKEILIASDLTKDKYKSTYSLLSRISHQFKSKVSFVTIVDSIEKIDTLKLAKKDLIKYLKKYNIDKKFNETLNSFKIIANQNVKNGLLEHLKYNKYDIIVMMPRHRNFWKKIFSSSTTKKVFNNSEIPVLVLPEDN